MAASQFLCAHPSFNGRKTSNFIRKSSFPAFREREPRSFGEKLQFQRNPFVKAVASDSEKSRKQVELVYDPEERLNRLADEVDNITGLSRLNLFSPCKINVFLRITRKREDGYHDLASLFHIIKALNLYRKKTDSDNFFWIHLDKRVPMGAGLGGGSSNAATALWAANQMSGCVATEKELQEWSSEIGSDVPFFFSHGAAYCTGRGEVVQDFPLPIPLDMPMVLVKPQQACSTAEVYKRLRMDQTSKVDPLVLLEKISEKGISQDVCVNDLELPAFEVLPSLKKLKQRVLAASRGQYDAVFMSGSGSTIVGIGSPDLPQFLYDDDEYQDVFLSEARFLTRGENQWYTEPASTTSSCDSSMEFSTTEED
ncbi:4-diphosphocytidyl-2-C-methyl-D-erythritol kinase, chloroplastic/chromoplastic isoform X2 [Telopea speciosissima]|uniref:4-diphosphocytidyl-2-C-methyl-D-erythritol kinase, chloroplastic/chromoplastic isoform X2 n=1 Tax=Telopea speciosissima TaxID=54955 RepID=UPI001CC65C80|nr:4-diphosphocytidyl-2-C-methyl-D-erythritol kinase, chloroplastic/chromoplastic isoform X2 [Telopea speciosissima]